MEAKEILKLSIEGALRDAGVPLQNARQELEAFYTRIEVPFAEALASNDDLSLDTFRDRAALVTGRVSLKTVYRYRQVVMTATITTLRVLKAVMV